LGKEVKKDYLKYLVYIMAFMAASPIIYFMIYMFHAGVLHGGG